MATSMIKKHTVVTKKCHNSKKTGRKAKKCDEHKKLAKICALGFGKKEKVGQKNQDVE